MSIDDTDLDTALRQWGDEQRARTTAVTVPPIADLLAGRRHNLAAVAASVVVVAAIAAGLGFGLHLGTTQTATPVASSPHSTSPMSSNPAHQSCSQEFVDAGSRFDSSKSRGLLILRYRGSNSCEINNNPLYGLVDAGGHVVGPHGLTGDEVVPATVYPGDTVRLSISVDNDCVPSGRYSLVISFRSSTATSGVEVPLGTLSQGGCASPGPSVVAALTTSFRVTGSQSSATLAKLTRIARQFAANDGDPAATAEAVSTTRGRIAANGLVQLVGPQARIKLWLVQLHGHFTGEHCARCLGGDIGIQVNRGSDQLLIFRRPGLDLIEGQTTHKSLPLSGLGAVVQLIP